ncbi:LuxR C-terminal-related transcriptional regulator [Actinospongicola halichondriae]|uniref:LuxR C-terminal-related transcriptional regulator n=1 Tax=Actinospongicola halichondriae TaxID=3236844 RepID=UPI003D55F2D2
MSISTGRAATERRCADALRILLIEDHEMVATAIGGTLRSQVGLEIAGTATTIADGVAAAHRLRPDIVVTDLRLPDGDVTEHIGDLLASSDDCRVLVITGAPSERALIDSMNSGAEGFLDKSQPLTDLVSAIRQVARGQVVVSPALMPALMKHLGCSRDRRPTLTLREMQILEHLADGLATADVADRLCISANTVRNHISKTLLKLGVHSRIAAISAATQRGLIGPRSPF